MSFLECDTCTAEVAIRREIKVSKRRSSSNDLPAGTGGGWRTEKGERFIRFIFEPGVAITCPLVSKWRLPNFKCAGPERDIFSKIWCRVSVFQDGRLPRVVLIIIIVVLFIVYSNYHFRIEREQDVG